MFSGTLSGGDGSSGAYGSGWNSSYDGAGRDIAGDDCVCADCGSIADGDAAEDRDATADPDLAANVDGPSGVTCVADSCAFGAQVIGVANT